MGDPAILFVKPKAISARDKKALQSAGVIVVEIDNPQDAKFVRAGAELSGSALLLAATQAIETATFESVRAEFGRAVCAAVQAAQSEN